MKSKEEILKLLGLCKQNLSSRYKISKIGLFGSYARGDQTDESDVDVLVDVDPSIGLDFVALADQIENTLGVSTDVVSRAAIKPRYRKSVESDLIYV